MSRQVSTGLNLNAVSVTFHFLQLVVMIAVRKSLDWIFTKHELRALDDLMPESSKKHKDEDDDEEVSLHPQWIFAPKR